MSQPNICVLENVSFKDDELADYVKEVGRDLFTADLRDTIGQFREAKNFGSLIVPKLKDVAELRRVIAEKQFENNLFLRDVHERVQVVLRMAAPGLVGECPGCQKPVLAKCGNQRVWHWAHRGTVACEFEREKETEWHREWKSYYPAEYQEVIRHDSTGERHIADVMTPLGLVIEFQHSRLAPEERVARESFHRNMVWVVDGTRLQRDKVRFLEGQRAWKRTIFKGFFVSYFPTESFPGDWLECNVPVFFDFDGISSTGDSQDVDKRFIVGLLPGRADGHAVILKMTRHAFLDVTRSRQEIMPAQVIIQQMAAHLMWERMLANAAMAARYPRHRQWKQWSRRKTAMHPKRRTARF